MKTISLEAALRHHPGRPVRLLLPDGGLIPAEFHITEAGHVVKRFIDCGGTVRTQESCLLQAWVSGRDAAHRLTTDKLAGILAKSRVVGPVEDLDVEVEYGDRVVAQYTIEAADAGDGELRLVLGNKHTDCLAREQCGVEEAAAGTGCGCGSGAGQCC
jgi:hypothetical protein